MLRNWFDDNLLSQLSADPQAHIANLANHIRVLRQEADLRAALRYQQFVLHYSPRIDMATGKVVAIEAQLRWDKPGVGLLNPSEFIATAEETGVITAIGYWVLRQACREGRRLQQECGRPLRIAVNLSPRQFADPALAADVAAAQHETGQPAAFLKLEITENLLMGDAGGAAATLEELKTLGVDLCIDDFGTGYSSLSYLHRFPIDTLKVDRSFIARMGDGQTEQIVRTILVLARTLGMRAVAEGVETTDQADSLRTMGCEYAQGYRFSHPVAGDAAGAMIWRQRLSA